MGDEVIVAVAETLQKTCRKDDIVMRLGGDEFALYIPDMKKEQAPFFIERLFGEFAKIIIPEMKDGKFISASEPHSAMRMSRFPLTRFTGMPTGLCTRVKKQRAIATIFSGNRTRRYIK